MKILFPYMARWKSANWSRYHSLLSDIAEAGHEVYVLQAQKLDWTETNFQEIEVNLPEKLRVYDVRIPDTVWNRKFAFEKIAKKGIYSLFSLGLARRLIKEKKIDLVFLYNIPQYPFLYLPVRRIVFDCADDYLDMLEHELGRLKNGLLMILARQLFHSMMNRSNLVLSVSNVLSRKYGGKMKVLPNGVDMRKMDYATRHPLNLRLQKPIVGFIGSFEYFIDFGLIIDVASRMPQITFLMVGGGRLWEQVRDTVKEKNLRNVILTGAVRHEDVFRYIGEMDICMNIFKKIPVSHGACPIKLFEYLSMKKPVITTRLEEILIIDKGFLEYGDTVEEVISSINRLIVDQDLRSKLSERGFQEVLREYTWSRISQRLLETFETM